MVRHDDEPLRVERSIQAAKLWNVGVDGELLPWKQDVCVDDGRLDNRTIEDALGGVEALRQTLPIPWFSPSSEYIP